MAGLVLFTVGGLLSLCAPDVRLLAAARFVQALGGCAGLVLGRAIVRDSSGMTQSVRRLAMINLITMVGPGLAPLLGQTVTDWLGWRFIFVLLIALGLLNLVLSWRILPETGRPAATSPQPAAARLRPPAELSPYYLALAIGGLRHHLDLRLPGLGPSSSCRRCTARRTRWRCTWACWWPGCRWAMRWPAA
jgi:DHA1 family bicyclomycin/chloramphenicol resistance-like MFS transporter